MVTSLGRADSHLEDLLAPQDLSFCCSPVVCRNNFTCLAGVVSAKLVKIFTHFQS